MMVLDEKAFNNLNLQWLFLVLETQGGFSGAFLNFRKDMYTAPIARILTTGMISDPIILHRGTRQGCPLSPLRLNLALDTLTRHVTQNVNSTYPGTNYSSIRKQYPTGRDYKCHQKDDSKKVLKT